MNDEQVYRQGWFFFEGARKALCYIPWRLCPAFEFPPASLQGEGWLDFNTMAFISPLHSGNSSQGAISSGKPTLAPGRESPECTNWDGIQRAGLFRVPSMPLQASAGIWHGPLMDASWVFLTQTCFALALYRRIIKLSTRYSKVSESCRQTLAASNPQQRTLSEAAF